MLLVFRCDRCTEFKRVGGDEAAYKIHTDRKADPEEEKKRDKLANASV